MEVIQVKLCKDECFTAKVSTDGLVKPVSELKIGFTCGESLRKLNAVFSANVLLITDLLWKHGIITAFHLSKTCHFVHIMPHTCREWC